MANKVNVGQTEKGQFLVTFPKAMAEAMRLKKGDSIEFIFVNGEVVVRKV